MAAGVRSTCLALGERLEVDTPALIVAGKILTSVEGTFVSSGASNAGSLGVGELGHPQLAAAVSDFCEQARREPGAVRDAAVTLRQSAGGFEMG